MDTAPEMPVGPPTSELLPERGTETTAPPTVDNARLMSSHSLERVDTAEHPQTVEGARVAGGVGSSGISTQSLELSSRWTIADLKLGLFFCSGDVEVPLGYKDYLRGLEELKALPLKQQRRHLKNDFLG